MRNGAGQLNVGHALATYFGDSNLDTAFFADDTTVLEPFVLAAKTFIVFDGAEDFGAEQTVTLGFERAVVDGLGLADFSVRPRAHLLRRSDADLDGIELLVLRDLFEKVE